MNGIVSMLSIILTLVTVLVDILLIATVIKIWTDMNLIKSNLNNTNPNNDMIDELATLKKKVKSLQKTKYIKNKK